VTILCNKFNGHPKGFAYVEFNEKDSVMTAVALDGTFLRGRQIKVGDCRLISFSNVMKVTEKKVIPKRTNIPGISSTNRPPRSGRGTFRTRAFVFGGYSYRLDRPRFAHAGFYRFPDVTARPYSRYLGSSSYYTPY
jgi:polyadenylate-binding protein 2